MKSLLGCPKVQMHPVENFFQRLEKDQANLPLWEGELYLELHNGTYTTQAINKKSNKFSEKLLYKIEYLGSLVSLLNPEFKFDKELIDKMWKMTLTHQFHDVIPGTCIKMVYDTTD